MIWAHKTTLAPPQPVQTSCSSHTAQATTVSLAEDLTIDLAAFKSGNIVELQSEILRLGFVAKRHINTKAALLDEKDASLDEKDVLLKAKDTQLNEKDATLRNKAAELAAKYAKLAAKDAELEAMARELQSRDREMDELVGKLEGVIEEQRVQCAQREASNK